MAGNSTKIDEVVDVASVTKQLTDTQAQSKALREEFLLLLKTTNDLNNALGKTTTTKAFKQAATEAEASANKIVSAQDKVTKTETRRQQLEEKRKRIVQESTAAEIALYEKTKNGIQGMTNATNDLNKAQSKQANQATAATAANQRYGNTVKTTSAEIANGAKNATTNLEVTATAATKATNYFTKAFSVIRQAAYLLPGIGISGIFSLGITGVVELVNALSQLEKQEQDLIVKSRDLREAITGGEYQTAVKDVTELRTNIELAKQGFISKEGVVKQYNETIGKTTGFVNSLDEAEKGLAKNADAYVKYTLYKAAAQLALNEAAKKAVEAAKEEQRDVSRAINGNREQRAEAYKDIPFLVRLKDAFSQTSNALKEYNKQTVESNKKAADQQETIAEDFQKKAAEIAKGFNFNFFDDNKNATGAKSNVFSQYLQQQKEVLDGVLQNEQASYDDRLLAITAFEQASKILIDKGVKAKEFTQIEANTKILDVTNNSAKARIKVESDAQKELLNLFKDGEKVQKEIVDNSLSVYQQYGLQRLQQIESDKNAAIDGLIAQLDEGKITLQEYQQQRADIEQQANIESARQTIDNFKLLIQARKEYGEDVDSEEKQLFDAQKKYDDLIRDIKIKNLELVENKRRELNEKIKALEFDLAQSLITLGQSLTSIALENQKNRLQGEANAIEEQKAREIQGVDNSLATEQEKADRIAVINAKAQADKEAIDRRQRKLDAEKARLQKIFSLAAIAVNAFEKIAQVQTIGAVLLANPLTAALAPLAFSQIPFIIGISAAQAAAVAAQPIPQYAKGTKNAKGGLSIIGEEGAEKVDLPNGKSFISASTAQLINLPAGTKVTPHGETMRMIGKPDDLQRYTGGQQVPWERVIAAMEKKHPAPKNKINIRIDGSFEKYRQNHFR